MLRREVRRVERRRWKGLEREKRRRRVGRGRWRASSRVRAGW